MHNSQVWLNIYDKEMSNVGNIVQNSADLSVWRKMLLMPGRISDMRKCYGRWVYRWCSFEIHNNDYVSVRILSTVRCDRGRLWICEYANMRPVHIRIFAYSHFRRSIFAYSDESHISVKSNFVSRHFCVCVVVNVCKVRRIINRNWRFCELLVKIRICEYRISI